MIKSLISKYELLNNPTSTTALKSTFEFNNLNVNIYFDAFDSKNPLLILILKFQKQQYMTQLKIKDNLNFGHYLPNISSCPEIFNRLLIENKLNSFYKHIEKNIMINKFIIINYQKDFSFINANNYNKKINNKDNLPFLSELRRTQMSFDQFNLLKKSFNIPDNVLNNIKLLGFTVVRTDDPKRRNSLRLILDKHNISIN